MSKRRLIIRPGGIGDCILAFPAMEYLVATAEYAEIWVPGSVVPLVHFGGAVRAIASTGLDLLGVGDVPPDPGLIAQLASFDHIVSWYGANRPEFRQLISADFHRALPSPEWQRSATDFFSSQVGAPIGAIPRIPIIPDSRRDTIVVHPFSGSKRKNWPLDNFRRVASLSKLEVEWCAGPEEELSGALRFQDLGALAKWLAGARGYLGNDSGITHLAAAIGIPTLAIFISSDPDVWAPRGPNVSVLRNPAEHEVSRLLAWWPLQASNAQSVFVPR